MTPIIYTSVQLPYLMLFMEFIVQEAETKKNKITASSSGYCVHYGLRYKGNICASVQLFCSSICISSTRKITGLS